MEQTQNRQAAQPAQDNVVKGTSPEQGREPGKPQQTATEPNTDISQVDQQEGDMNLGELGGNFDAAEAKEGA